MKKIPTLFERVFKNNKIVDIKPNITQGCEEAFIYGVATVKIDGSCCAIINGELYKRYDARNGKKPPVGAIPCCESDPITGHYPHWVKVNAEDPSDKWFIKALNSTPNKLTLSDGTYEAVGKHFNGNPYKLSCDYLVKHGEKPIIVERTFEDVKKYLTENYIEGIVFWLNNEPICKIKRSDFGLDWGRKTR